MNRFSAFMFLAVLCFPASAFSQQAQELTITTWGGAYEASQRKAYFDPFTKETGVEIRLEAYDGGVEALRRRATPGGVEWDVLDMTEPDALAACAERACWRNLIRNY